jgi:uncharacterized protein with NRDE domain
MCLILFGINEHPDFPLILAANRDEYLARPTAPAGVWPGGGVLAGRDLVAGGTWLGVSRSGRLVAVTNVREPDAHDPTAESRGQLVSRLLECRGDPVAMLDGTDPAAYNGFNMLIFEGRKMAYATNRGAEGVRVLESGVHGLSNARLDTPWPKVMEGTRCLAGLVAGLNALDPDPAPFFDLLSRSVPAPDASLPHTGVSLELERALSPAFIRTDNYGTRSSTVIMIRRDHSCLFVERTFPAGPGTAEDRRFMFTREAEKVG